MSKLCRQTLKGSVFPFAPSAYDEGAISLLALFFLIVLLGGLAALLGLNFEIRLREGLQDGSDAIAFSAAIILARGMNLLVLFNQIMMLLVAILVALRLAQSLLIVASIVAAALAWVTFGASLAISATLATTANQFGNAYRSAKPIVFNGLRALESAQALTQSVTAPAAAADSLFEKSNHSWVEGAFALPSSWQLPVEKDKFSVLCGKSSQWVLSLALAPLTSFSGEVSQKAQSGSEAMGKKTSGFLCGEPDSSAAKNPPTHEQTLEVRLPETEGALTCQRDPSSPACRDALQLAEAESPDSNTGQCPLSSDCKLNSLYFQRASLARNICGDPRKKVKSYQYQQHHVEADYLRIAGDWLELERRLTRPRLIETTRPPCGPRGTMSDQWEKTGEDPDGKTPVCDNIRPEYFTNRTKPGEQITIRYQQVTRIFSCVVNETKSIPIAHQEDRFDSQAAGRGPLKLKSSFELGGSSSQVRALVWTQRSSPIQPQNYGESYDSLNEEKSRFAFSQAEYFFDHDGSLPRSEWMWERRWKARLRQVRFPEDKDSSSASRPSSQEGADCKEKCSSGLKLMQSLQGLILH